MTGTQNERQNYGSGRCVCVGRGGEIREAKGHRSEFYRKYKR